MSPCLIFIFFFFSKGVYSDNGIKSSAFEDSKHRIDSLLSLTDNVNLTTEVRLNLSKEALSMSRKSNYQYGILHATYNIGRTKFYQSNLNESFVILDSLLTYMTVDSAVLTKVVDYNLTRSKILSMIAIIFQELDDYKTSMQYYLNALQLIENTNNKYDIALIYKGLGGLNLKAGNTEKSHEYFNKAMALSETLGDFKVKFDIIQQQYAYHLEKKEYNKALEEGIKLQNLARQDKMPYMNAIALKNLGEAYFLLREYSIATSYLSAVTDADTYSEFTNVLSECYSLLSKISTADHNFIKGEYYADKALKYAEKTSIASFKAEALLDLALSQQKAGKYSEAFKNLRMHLTLKDSINELHNSHQVLLLQSKYDLNKVKDEKMLVENRLTIQTLKNSRNNFLIFSFLIIIILMGLLSFIQIRKRRSDNKMNTILNLQKAVIREQEEIIQKEKEEHLKSELEHKNRELVTRAMTLTQYQEDKKVLIENLKQIKSVRKGDEDANQIDSLIHKLEISTSSDAWEDFRLSFENVYSAFYKSLSKEFPNLTSNELKLCALLKLNLNTKDIASLTCREVRSVESARNRLRKHMKLQPEVNLVAFLNRF